jgi:tRNA U34 5-methylaminomethyl-2-thiouridine-forming methyltransferase MnmC
MRYELRRQANGAMALFRADLGETMHPGLGPWEEALRVYIQGTALERLLAAREEAGGEIVVFDVGLGGAANAVAAIDLALRLSREKRRTAPLRIVSFEQDLAAPRFALEQARALPYLQGHEPALRTLLERGQWECPGIVWELRQGDFTRQVREEPRRADVVFFDPFSPRSNPGMWCVPLLEDVYRCHRPGRVMRLATYSSAFGARAALLLAGFYVGEGPALGAGRHATLAATDLSALAAPLGRAWLGRWRRDREPWPPLTPPASRPRLRELLMAHPQWQRFDGGGASTDDGETPRPLQRRQRGHRR